MSLSRNDAAADDGGRAGARAGGDAGTFGRSFKYAVIAYAVAEFVAIALLLYYKAAR